MTLPTRWRTLNAQNVRNGNVVAALVDYVTSALACISTDHMFIHEGKAFNHSEVLTVSGSASIAFHTPADKYVHWKPAGVSASGGPVTVTLVEAPTISGGTPKTPYNRNRLSATASAMVVKSGVTPTGGTVIYTLLLPSSTSGAQKLGASTEAAEEYVLKRDTEYVIKFDETATGDVTVGLDAFWYEELGA